MAKKYTNYIDGEWCEAASGKRFENRNPANWDEVIGTFPDSAPDDLNRAVASAASAFNDWRLTRPPLAAIFCARLAT